MRSEIPRSKGSSLVPPALTIDHLGAAWGPVQVLWDVSFVVDDGASTLVLGANGAGKSTLLATLVGLHEARGGSISMFGESVDRVPAHRRARLGVAFMSEQGIFPSLSIRENLVLGGLRLPSKERTSRIDEVLAMFPELTDRLAEPAGSLSGGQRKMVGIAKCLMAAPRLLIMDEPSAGLAPRIVNEVIDRLRDLHGHGITLLVAEQNVSFLELATDVIVLEGGRVRFCGSRDTFEHDNQLREAFFGLEGLQEL